MISFLNTIVVFVLQIPMADTFRSEGKIYVVIAVILILLFGMFFYLFRLDSKVNRLDEEIKNKLK